MKRIIIIFVVLLIILMVSACKAAPSENLVVNKNDGAFDAAILQEDASEGNEKVQSYTEIDFIEDFYSSDNSVFFHFEINDSLYSKQFPVLQVCPHHINEREAQIIAKVLFDGIDIYEYKFNRLIPQSTLEDKLLFWGQLANDDILMDLYGKELYIEAKRAIEEMIASQKGGSIAGETPQELCEWTFYPESHYFSPGIDGNTTILASTNSEDVNYIYWVTNRDENDYRIHNITAYVSSEYSSPWDMETLYTIRKMCGTSKPDSYDLMAVGKKAAEMIRNMDIGEWKINYCEIGVYPYWRNEDSPAYVINVSATPVYDDVPVLYLPQLDNLKSDDVYSSNYYYTQLDFSFSKSGELISFSYTSPIDLVSTINKNASILSFDEAMNSAIRYLQYTDAGSYDFLLGNEDGTSVDVEVNEVELGLARVKMKDNSNDFYLVPAIQLKGDYRVSINDTEVYSFGGIWGDKATFLVINLIDGSIIDVKLGY